MVTLELNYIGEVKIQGSQMVSGPDYLNPTINILMQKCQGTCETDKDLRVAKNLVEMMGGKILEYVKQS